ncbi:MAG TPA: RNA polymerase sigma factor [Bdellovibrionales bacterium]|nr:RNA polymerase sigma factor [Bdellovibrionales bacterium]
MTKLVLGAQSGDEGALSDLIEATQRELFRFTYYLCGNNQLAHDLCQDTFIKVLEGIGNLKEPHRFKSWLFTMAKNLYLDHNKSSKNKGHVSLDSSPDLESSEDKQKVMEIRQALSHLEAEERIPLLLVDLEGHSYQEAAQIIGISEDALRSRLHRARQTFSLKYKKS